MNKALEILNERAKELRCIYEVDELLMRSELSVPDIIRQLLRIIPPGWQFPTVCEVMVKFQGQEYRTDGFKTTEWMQHTDIVIDNNIVGHIKVCYTQFIRDFGGSQFLPEEQRLLNTIANRLGNYIFHKQIEHTLPLLSEGSPGTLIDLADLQPHILSTTSDEHWKWRFRVAERIGREIDMQRFGLKALYLIGSTLDGNAGPGSDIDLIAHSSGDADKEAQLRAYLEGWGLCLTELNFIKSGYKSDDPVIDLHIITDEDIRIKSSYAAMIGSAHANCKCLKRG